MNAIEIVANYLKANGYGGLAKDECGCELAELCPCGEIKTGCEPAHVYRAGDPEFEEWRDMAEEEGFDFVCVTGPLPAAPEVGP
jgi:hypothetical protein